MPDARNYRRHLPHWRVDGAIYFVTWRLAAGQAELDARERDLIASALRRFDGTRYELWAFVVMNDHVHAVLTPKPEYSLQLIVHSWKSFIANFLQRESGRRGRIWQDEYFDRIMRDDGELEEKVNYILTNPWKRWPAIASYPWVWVKSE